MKSSFLSLNLRDAIKGFIVAVLAVVVSGLVTVLQSGSLPDWATVQALLVTGLAAGLAYIAKNFFTNSQDQFAKVEPKPEKPK